MFACEILFASCITTEVGTKRMTRLQDARSAPAGLRGAVPPCITFFDDRGSIDESRLRRHVDWLIEAQVDGLLVGGTCGEFSALEISERERLAELSVDCAADRVPVCIGVMHTSTRTGTRLARHAESAGAAAVVSVPPYYSSPPEREVRTYFRDLAEAVEIPLVVYNNPAASGVSLSVPTLAKLAQEGTPVADFLWNCQTRTLPCCTNSSRSWF